jgi:hypothetical protein
MLTVFVTFFWPLWSAQAHPLRFKSRFRAYLPPAFIGGYFFSNKKAGVGSNSGFYETVVKYNKLIGPLSHRNQTPFMEEKNYSHFIIYYTIIAQPFASPFATFLKNIGVYKLLY